MSAMHVSHGNSSAVIVTRLRREHAPQIVRAAGLFDEKPDLQATRSYLADSRNLFLLATLNSTPVGFLRATALRQIKTRRAQMFLYEIGIDLRHRRKGIGGTLVDWLLEYCRKNDFDEMFVLTSPRNRAAVRLYRSTGAVTETEADRMFVYRLARKRH